MTGVFSVSCSNKKSFSARTFGKIVEKKIDPITWREYLTRSRLIIILLLIVLPLENPLSIIGFFIGSRTFHEKVAFDPIYAYSSAIEKFLF